MTSWLKYCSDSYVNAMGDEAAGGEDREPGQGPPQPARPHDPGQ